MSRLQSLFKLLFLLLHFLVPSAYGGPVYDPTAYTDCKVRPELPLYNGGLLKGLRTDFTKTRGGSGYNASSPTFLLHNLAGWVRIKGADSALICAGLTSGNENYKSIGTVIAKSGCWSFLKGGFVLQSPSNLSVLYFQNLDEGDVSIKIASASLQMFTGEEWRNNQQNLIDTERKRAVTIHVSNANGEPLQGAEITLEQVSNDFPFGSAIAKTILGNPPYQKWFVERFNAAVFEDELKWYATEPRPGQVNYTIPDQMLEFVRAHQIMVRGHNIFWENPNLTPSWVRSLNSSEFESAVSSRITSLMRKYKGQFIHWDVNNEMLHYDFYEQRLGANATLKFFKTAQQADPLATLFMNEFNVIETCDDVKSTVDAYVMKLQELKQVGISMGGIGLQGHFGIPNPPLIRGILDKLATLKLPIWITEADISKNYSQGVQAEYLETVLRETFSHPSVKGIMLWTALHPSGCYEMCLTDINFQNLPAGNVVDKLLIEWQTKETKGETDERGSCSFHGFLGEYKVTAIYGNRTASSSFSLSQGTECLLQKHDSTTPVFLPGPKLNIAVF